MLLNEVERVDYKGESWIERKKIFKSIQKQRPVDSRLYFLALPATPLLVLFTVDGLVKSRRCHPEPVEG